MAPPPVTTSREGAPLPKVGGGSAARTTILAAGRPPSGPLAEVGASGAFA
ncbi:hypothetical protein STTU_2131 [Streptomyces sp. Tu6071]|nr:hypothetical protein STTU_2131 [Streptomyces sp. Tu6071]